MDLNFIGIIFFVLLFLYLIYKTALAIRIVPRQDVYVVERFGKYSKSLYGGFHLLMPFIERVAYILTLKEEAIDVPSQICITRDNVKVEVDGVVYLKVVEPEKAAYNINNYRYGLIQLAQTTMRSLFGQLDLDKSFEEREAINAGVIKVVDEAAKPWGIQILRYEIQNISPPRSVLDAMEKQMSAERQKRATIATSEGQKQSKINESEGRKQELINISEGEKQKKINDAEAHAAEIRAIARATAEGIRKIALAASEPGGMEAIKLDLSQEYLKKLNGLAHNSTNVILPVDISNLSDTINGLDQYIEGDVKKK